MIKEHYVVPIPHVRYFNWYLFVEPFLEINCAMVLGVLIALEKIIS